ncbi:MAG: PRC-barrel domain-containing protein [Spirochaetota bacterium]
MYLRLSRLRRFTGSTVRIDLGSVDTLYFDPDDWAVRFLSLGSRAKNQESVSPVVSPMQIRRLSADDELIEIDARHGVYRLEISDGHRPLDAGTTNRIADHYDLPVFWDGPDVWGEYASPRRLAESAEHSDYRAGALRTRRRTDQRTAVTPQLYPHNTLMGRGVFSPDGRLGVISDLLIDVNAWRIRYFIVWLQAPGETGEVLLSPFWVNGPPEKTKVTVPMTTEAIVNGPNFAPEDLEPLDERILARYFGFLTEQ